MDLGRPTSAHLAPVSAQIPFEALAHFSLDGLAYIDDHDRVAVWNEAAASVTGISAEHARGTPLATMFANSEKIFASRDPRAHAVRLSPMNDPLRSIDAVYVPIDGGMVLSFGPQRRFAAIEQVKNEVLSAVSHELKTPLAVIKAFATTLRSRHEMDLAERTDYLATIEEQADVLTRAIDALLLAGRVDAHDLPVQRVSTPLAALLDGALADVDAHYRDRAIERHDQGAITGDPDLLRQAFAQILENAFKFSHPQSLVTIDAATRENETIVRVTDRGIGIAGEHLPYIFDRFYRIETTTGTAQAGTGLGLHIARAIVFAHGGSISAASAHGAGTTITVTLPVRT